MAKLNFSEALKASLLNASIDASIDTKASKTAHKTARAKLEVDDAVATDPTEPKKERAKLDTPELVNRELKRLYRRFSNKQINAAELKARVAALGAIREGMADPVENTGDFEPATFNIFSVPENHFMTGEQLTALKNGQPIVPLEQCTPMRLTDGDQTNSAPEPQPLEPSRRELRNAHFRPEFQDLPVAPPVTEQVVEPVDAQPVESYHEMLLRKAHEDEAAGKCVIMRPPREAVRWPKPPAI